MIEIALLKPGGSAATALYIVAFSMFILGVKRGTHPTTAKQREHGRRRRHGWSPSSTTLLLNGIGNWGLIVVGHRDRRGDRRRSPRSASR